jgi:ATP-dependent Clp protease protease subunit
MLHQPWGGIGGQASDIEIHARELLDWRVRINEILVQNTKQTVERINEVTERDYFLTPEEALEFGLIDEILTSAPIP